MGVLQDKLDSIVRETCSHAAVTKRVLLLAAKQRGITLSDSEVEELQVALRSAEASASGKSVQILRSGGEVLVLTVDELKAALAQISEEAATSIDLVMKRALTDLPPNVLESLYQNAPAALKDRRRMFRGFRKRLWERWKEGLDRLEMLIMIAHETGEAFFNDIRRESAATTTSAPSERHLIDVIVGLNIRACRAASEILCLLKGGFSDGANARWRSLHEIAVTATFVAQHKGDVPIRYLRHAHVERYKAATQYQNFSHALNHAPFEQKELDALAAPAADEVARYGSDFKGQYGWAAKALGKAAPTFADIEASLALDRWRPYYKIACHSIHAGSQGLFWSLGTAGDQGPQLLAGPSNSGLCDPGHSTAISLTMTTAALLSIRSNVDLIVSCRVMQSLCDDIGEALLEAHKKLEKDIADQAAAASQTA